MMRPGQAPVWVNLVGAETGRSHVMTPVDCVGIVLATGASCNVGVACPWYAITSVFPEKHKGKFSN